MSISLLTTCVHLIDSGVQQSVDHSGVHLVVGCPRVCVASVTGGWPGLALVASVQLGPTQNRAFQHYIFIHLVPSAPSPILFFTITLMTLLVQTKCSNLIGHLNGPLQYVADSNTPCVHSVSSATLLSHCALEVKSSIVLLQLATDFTPSFSHSTCPLYGARMSPC